MCALPICMSMQVRVNLETMNDDGSARPAGGVLIAHDPPGVAGVRVDGYGYAGYRTSPAFDSLLAKLIAFGADRAAAYARARRALGEMAVEGLATSLPFHRWILDNDDFIAGRTSTGWTEQHWTPER